jgi:hypothetical protein
VNRKCDMIFDLFGVETGGDVPLAFDTKSPRLVDGYYNVKLDFGEGAFTGDARWVRISVRCPSGTGNHVTLKNRVRRRDSR